MVSAVSNNSAAKNLVSNLSSANQAPKAPPSQSPRNEAASTTTQSVSANQKTEAQAAAKNAAAKAENDANTTKVTITQQPPQPSTTNRDTKPAEQYKAVSAIRS